jgi:hypothetical protein
MPAQKVRIKDLLTGVAMPMWAISVFFHVIAVFLATLFLIPPNQERGPASFETQLSEILEEPKLDQPEMEPLPLEPPQTLEVQPDTNVAPEAMAAAVSDSNVEAASLSNVDLPAMDSVTKMLEGAGAATTAAKGIGGSLEGRGKAKQGLLVSEGGTKRTEMAVNAGLTWLVRHQFPDGRWSIQYRKDSPKFPGTSVSDSAATGLALLPLLSANHRPGSGQHGAAVGKGLGYLISIQQPSGVFKRTGDQSTMYSHGLCAIAMCEAYGLTKDIRFKRSAERAIKFLIDTQNSTNGWRYEPNSKDADTSVFGWCLMALKSAQMAGIEIDKKIFEKCDKYLDSVASGSKKGLYAYDYDSPPRAGMTAIGILCRQYRGAKRNDPMIIEGINYLTKTNPPERTRDIYYWYYGTQAVHNFQGPEWDRWNREIRRVWVETQERDPKNKDFGSWDPAKVDNPKSHSIEAGGRLYVTSIGLLQLTVYYRYLPVYRLQEEESTAAK